VKYADEMGSGGRLYAPKFMKIVSGIQKLIQTYREQGELVSLSYFFRMRKVG
jgi:hypothetical protein